MSDTFLNAARLDPTFRRAEGGGDGATAEDIVGPAPGLDGSGGGPQPIGGDTNLPPGTPGGNTRAPSTTDLLRRGSSWNYDGGLERTLGIEPGVSYGEGGVPQFQYFGGDEYAPRGWAPRDIAKLQAQLEAAGLLERPYQSGFWDERSADAYRTLLGYANSMGIPWHATLGRIDEAISTYGRGGDDSEQRRPLHILLTDPGQISDLANEVANRTIGHRLSDDELSWFTSTFHDMQRNFQRQLHQAQITESDTELTTPSLGGFANTVESDIKAKYPQEAAEMGYIRNANAFFDLLGSAGG